MAAARMPTVATPYPDGCAPAPTLEASDGRPRSPRPRDERSQQHCGEEERKRLEVRRVDAVARRKREQAAREVASRVGPHRDGGRIGELLAFLRREVGEREKRREHEPRHGGDDGVPPRSDVALAALAAALAALELSLNEAIEPKPVAAATGLAAALVLAWRRSLPLATTTVVAASMAAGSVLGVPLEAR